MPRVSIHLLYSSKVMPNGKGIWKSVPTNEKDNFNWSSCRLKYLGNTF